MVDVHELGRSDLFVVVDFIECVIEEPSQQPTVDFDCLIDGSIALVDVSLCLDIVELLRHAEYLVEWVVIVLEFIH
jgi:hypothetical protein